MSLVSPLCELTGALVRVDGRTDRGFQLDTLKGENGRRQSTQLSLWLVVVVVGVTKEAGSRDVCNSMS
jgi:hypothetical protein